MNKSNFFLAQDFTIENADLTKIREFNESRIDAIKYIYEMLAKRIAFLKEQIEIFKLADDLERIEILNRIDTVGNIENDFNKLFKAKPRDFFANMFKEYIEGVYLEEIINLYNTLTNFFENTNENDLLEILHFLGKTKCCISLSKAMFERNKNNAIVKYKQQAITKNKKNHKKDKLIINSNVNKIESKEIEDINKKITKIKECKWFGEKDYEIILEIEEILGLNENYDDSLVTNLERSYYESNRWDTDWQKETLRSLNCYSNAYLKKFEKTMLFVKSIFKLHMNFSKDLLNDVNLPDDLKNDLKEQNEKIAAKENSVDEALTSKPKSIFMPNLAAISHKSGPERILPAHVEENNNYLNLRFTNFRNQYYIMRCFDLYSDEGINLIENFKNVYKKYIDSAKELYGELPRSARTAPLLKTTIKNQQISVRDKEQLMINIIEEIHVSRKQEEIINEKIQEFEIKNDINKLEDNSINSEIKLQETVFNLAKQKDESQEKLKKFIDKQRQKAEEEKQRNKSIADIKIEVTQKLKSEISLLNTRNFYLDEHLFDKETVNNLNEFYNYDKIRFSEFVALIKRLGGTINTSSGGSHHKVEFIKNEKSYAFSIVKREHIDRVNLKIVRNRLKDILPENWQELDMKKNSKSYLAMSA